MSQVSDKTHKKIMTAAKELVSMRGRASVGIADVTRYAGVSKATIYRDREFLEWWKNSRVAEIPDECPNCVQLSNLKEKVRSQRSQIRVLEDSLSRTTAALTALATQVDSKDKKISPLRMREK